MHRINGAFTLFIACAALTACGGGNSGSDDPDGGACSVSAWAAPDFEQTAADALALRAQLGTLVSFMSEVEAETEQLTMLSQLTDLYEAGDPSLAAAVQGGYSPIINETFEDFLALSENPGADLIDEQGNWAPGDSGGIFGDGTRGLNAGGLESRQLVDKGLFGAGAFYAYALGLTEGTITPATIDALAAAWGSGSGLDTEELDDSAGYSHDMGFHAEIAAALTDAKAYAADEDCTAERDAAIQSFFAAWELALMARTVYYANETAAAMQAASELAPGAEADTAYANALHELGEGVGLALGFYGLADPASGPMSGGARVITDTQIETMMTAIGVDLADLNASTTGEFVSDQEGMEAAVVELEAVIEQTYGLTEAEVDAWHEETPG